MADNESSGGRGGSVLDGLLAPLRFPERVVEALESLPQAARELGQVRVELTRVREQTEPLAGMVTAVEQVLDHTERVPEMLSLVERISRQAEPLEQLLSSLERLEEGLGGRIDSLSAVVGSLESEESHLNQRVVELVGELRTMHETVTGVKGDVETLTDRMPDSNRGPLERARDVFTSNSEDAR